MDASLIILVFLFGFVFRGRPQTPSPQPSPTLEADAVQIGRLWRIHQIALVKLGDIGVFSYEFPKPVFYVQVFYETLVSDIRSTKFQLVLLETPFIANIPVSKFLKKTSS